MLGVIKMCAVNFPGSVGSILVAKNFKVWLALRTLVSWFSRDDLVGLGYTNRKKKKRRQQTVEEGAGAEPLCISRLYFAIVY